MVVMVKSQKHCQTGTDDKKRTSGRDGWQGKEAER